MSDDGGAANKKVVNLKFWLEGHDEREDDDGDGGGGGGGSPPPPPPVPGDPIWGSDKMVGDALSDELGDDWLCAHPGGHWYYWDGHRWDGRRGNFPVYMIAANIIHRIGMAAEKPALARDISSRRRAWAAVDLAGHHPRHARWEADFDRDDDWQLNTPDGIVQLRNGHLMPSARGRLLTRLTGASPSATEGCPRWMQFLDEITGADKELQQYLQKIAGYCLTGSVEEHAIFFLFGKSRTGKTVFLSVMAALLGDYAITAAMDMFLATDGMRHSTELMDLRGMRLVIAGEVPEGRHWDDGKLKQISGGEKIRANRMRENTIEFVPHCKLLFAGNHRPRLRADDDGMRTRFRVILFRFRQPVLDKHLTDKLKEELPGIFCWAIEGEMLRQKFGMAPPRVVEEATNEYFENEDIIGRWAIDRCVRGGEYNGLTEQFYASYKSWAERVGERVPSLRVFAQRMQLVDGVERWRHPLTGRRGFSGIGLLVQQEEMAFGAPRQPTPSE